jgi:hypothetical protein
MPAMYLAGLPIPGADVLELARLVNDPRLAERLGTVPASSPWMSRSARRSCGRWTTHRRRRSPSSVASFWPSTPVARETGLRSGSGRVRRRLAVSGSLSAGGGSWL